MTPTLDQHEDEDVTLNWRDVNVAVPSSDSSLLQTGLAFQSLSVIRRSPENGGGMLLLVGMSDGKRVKFLLDEAARDHLVAALSREMVPITVPSFEGVGR